MDEEENEVNHGKSVASSVSQRTAPAAAFPTAVRDQQVSLASSGNVTVFVLAVNGEPENRVQRGNGYFQVPPHTPVIFGEAGGRTLFRWRFAIVLVAAQDAALLHQFCPVLCLQVAV